MDVETVVSMLQQNHAVLVLDAGGIADAEKSPEYAKLKEGGRCILLIDAFQTMVFNPPFGSFVCAFRQRDSFLH
jgi:hypothetical protein